MVAAVRRLAWLVPLAGGLVGGLACGGPGTPPREDAAVVAAPAPVPRPRDAAVVALDAPAPPAIPPAAIAITLVTDNVSTPLRWGYAVGVSDGLEIALFDRPVDCATANMLNERELGGAELRIDVRSGPGGRFFAGHPASAKLFVWNDQAADVPAPVTQRLGALSFQLSLSDASDRVTLEPVGPKAGAHVRGTVEAASATLVGAAEAHGTFDVLLCDDLEPQPPRLRTSAPAGPARGTRGGKVLAPRSWQAIVWSLPATRDEAVSAAIDRGPGSLAEIFMLVGYPGEHVPCPASGQRYVAEAHPIVAFQGIGGASREHPLVGTPQPTTFLVPTPGELDYPMAVWPAWIQLDELTFAPGERVHATVWAEASTSEDAKGTFGGHLDAVVCAP